MGRQDGVSRGPCSDTRLPGYTHCRFWKSYFRNVPYNGTRFIFAVVLALLFGSILWNVGHKKCALGHPSHGCLTAL